MSRGPGRVMRRILSHLTTDWQELGRLASRTYDLPAGASPTDAQLEAARRAMHRLQDLGWAETAVLSMADALPGRSGRPLGPRYLHARLSGLGRDEQLRQAAGRHWHAARRERELHRSWPQKTPAAGRDDATEGDRGAPMRLEALALLLSGLQQFEAHYEDYGTDTITGPDGVQYSLWDVKDIYGRRVLLSREDAVVIEVGLYHSAGDHAPDDPHIMRILRRLCDVAGVPCELTPRCRPSAALPQRLGFLGELAEA